MAEYKNTAERERERDIRASVLASVFAITYFYHSSCLHTPRSRSQRLHNCIKHMNKSVSHSTLLIFFKQDLVQITQQFRMFLKET